MRSIRACCAIRPTARCGSPTARTSATSASSSSIRRPASACIPERKPINIAINSEASIMIFHDGWYYLLVTHGSCCAGGNSSYNIRMGRSRKVTGPFLDNMGVDMLQGGGKLFAGSSGRHIGPGHFGLLDLGDGVQKFSCHYEADLDRGGISVLDIRPLLWRDGWPVAGDNLDGRHLRDRVGAHRHGARDGGAGRAGRRRATGGADAGRRRCRRLDAAMRRRRHRRRRFQRRMRAGRRRTGPAARSTCAWRRTCCRRSRNGPSRRSPMPAAIPGRPTSRSPSPARIARSPRPRMRELAGRSRLHRRAGTTVAHRSAHRRHVSADAEGRAELERAAGAFGGRQQHADAREFNAASDRQRWLLKTP